jgi:hypothetical protein
VKTKLLMILLDLHKLIFIKKKEKWNLFLLINLNKVFISKGGFSKVYKVTWIDGPIIKWNYEIQPRRKPNYTNYTVALKELNSKNITSRELNEVKYILYIQ